MTDTTSGAGRSAGDRPPEAILKAVADILRKWDGGASLDDLLDAKRSFLPPRIAAAASSILFHYFRNKRRVDSLLQSVSRKETAGALGALTRAAATQVLFLRGVPIPVVVSTAVDEARLIGGDGAGRFMNAVLRKIPELHRSTVNEGNPFPEEISSRWRGRMSDDGFQRAAKLLTEPNEYIYARLCGKASSPDGWESLEPFAFAPGFSFVRRDVSGVGVSEAGLEGLYVQDPATAAAPSLFSAMDGARILDACAAPGGKTLALAELFPICVRLVACDRSARRLRRLSENAARLGVSDRITAAAADLLSAPFPAGSFDRILLDAPCSNTGVFRSRPDALWRFSMSRLWELAAFQLRLLLAASELAGSRAEIVYSTCSVEPEEGHGIVEQFLWREGARFELAGEVCLSASALHDGAYAALLRRKS